MSLFDLLNSQYPEGLSDHDLSHLADWADRQKNEVANPEWKKPFALLREGADLLLRRRAMSKAAPLATTVTGVLEWTSAETESFGRQASQPQPEPTEHLVRAMKTSI